MKKENKKQIAKAIMDANYKLASTEMIVTAFVMAPGIFVVGCTGILVEAKKYQNNNPGTKYVDAMEAVKDDVSEKVVNKGSGVIKGISKRAEKRYEKLINWANA